MDLHSKSPISLLLEATPRHHKTPHGSPARPSTPPSPSPARGSTAALSTLTPQARLPSRGTTAIRPDPSPWPRLGTKVSEQDLSEAAAAIFGYAPRDWQLKTAIKLLEGHDVMVVAGTGAGKSMVFGLLAIAAELAGSNGLVLVVCPLKALQTDQVRRFNEYGAPALRSTDSTEGNGPGEASGGRSGPSRPFARLRIRAVAINEDNNDKAVFTSLRKGRTRLCYASPECLLRNDHFKQLFRDEAFRKLLVSVLVDEAHVIAQWADLFRKDYGELSQLRILTGTEIPWGLLSATFPTQVFNRCFSSVRMGDYRAFWGLDLGSDRRNVAQWVRRMEYPRSSFASLFAFIPQTLNTIEDLPKTILYFRTRRDARTACGLLRRLLPATLRELLWPYTAVFTEFYKETIMERFRTGTARWLFCTDAAGMGCDIPDIDRAIIYGIQDLCSAFQKGGRAARSSGGTGTMVWLVEDWVFEDEPEAGRTEVEGRREKLDPAARAYVNRTQGDQCMRELAVEYFHPEPEFVPLGEEPGYQERQEVKVAEGTRGRWPLTWVAEKDGEKVPAGSCCSARSCRADALTPIGLLSDDDRKRIANMRAQLRSGSAALLPDSRPSSPVAGEAPTLSPSRRCSKAERAILNEVLHTWRSSRWSEIAARNTFLSYHWVMDDDNIRVLVAKAHKLINVRAPHRVDATLTIHSANEQMWHVKAPLHRSRGGQVHRHPMFH
ncbi:P-loop containing nucleoside triphosphate hydrolase protein [Ganoderma leucocontextum]|nr:P-loop containing nucleoside triphosphate hydrolase protein [Ganoderma leucocontextum]